MSTAISSTADVAKNDCRQRPKWVREAVRWAVPLGLCCLGALCFCADMPVAEFIRAGRIPKFVNQALEQAEVFGHGVGVAYLVLAISVLDARRRSWVPTLLFGAMGGGLAANSFKLVVSRMRPRNMTSLQASVWETFGPLWHGELQAAGDSHSFPSAHTGMATGFAVVLSAMYPQGRWLFFGFAALVGLQRIVSSSHFPSDVCVGAAVGWVMGQAALALRQWRRGENSGVSLR